jgi:hypothetical protein
MYSAAEKNHDRLPLLTASASKRESRLKLQHFLSVPGPPGAAITRPRSQLEFRRR